MIELRFNWQNAGLLFLLLFAYKLCKAVYRITLHPLAKFPGPKLAALTYKYEFWFDGIKYGQYTNQIERLHEKYGPIIRINPDELHCSDPAFIDQIYAGSGKKRDKHTFALGAFGPRQAGFGTRSHNLHRNRRGPLNRFFSKASVTKLEPLIHSLAQQLSDKLLARAGDGKPIDIAMAYSCYTTDVITSYCFGQGYGFLTQDDFEPNLRHGIYSIARPIHIMKQWPLIVNIMESLPDAIGKLISIDIATFINHMNNLTEDIRVIKQKHGKGELKDVEGRPTIFRELLDSDLPESEKSLARLGAESITLVTAGTETTGSTLAVGTFYILNESSILSKLEAELKTVVTDPQHLPNWTTLEKLPYLISVSIRLPRVAPEETLFYKGVFKGPNDDVERTIEHVIPPGSAIGMSSALIHRNETIFPDAGKFKPERWLNEKGEKRKDLDGYLLSFSKGSRQCLGINLAFCELYMALAALVLRVFPHMELYETTVDDVKYHHDCNIPMTRSGSQGVRVLVN